MIPRSPVSSRLLTATLLTVTVTAMSNASAAVISLEVRELLP